MTIISTDCTLFICKIRFLWITVKDWSRKQERRENDNFEDESKGNGCAASVRNSNFLELLVPTC